MSRLRPWLPALLALVVPTSAASASEFELKDGDRVVLIGSTLIERDQSYGYLETLLTAAHPGETITFRNLGWSGDTVRGEAQAGFGTAEDGFRHLKEHVEALKPTVLLVGFGANESFDGEAGLSRFDEGLNALLDALEKTGARITLLSPNPMEDLGRPLPDPRRHNDDLSRYRAAIRGVAERRGLDFVDLFDRLCPPRGSHLTDDGLHLTPPGYWVAGRVIARHLGAARPRWVVRLDAAKREADADGTRLTNIEWADGGLRFEAKDATLPEPPIPDDRLAAEWPSDRRLVVRGLPPGDYRLKVDGREVASSHADGGEVTVRPGRGPEFDQVERLRKAIVEKNRLYFYRWRPQNETYLFGFRKHEQGQNAREIPKFDPLVAAREAEIAKLRLPMRHRYELVREEDAGR